MHRLRTPPTWLVREELVDCSIPGVHGVSTIDASGTCNRSRGDTIASKGTNSMMPRS